jgi:hypothetical protein
MIRVKLKVTGFEKMMKAHPDAIKYLKIIAKDLCEELAEDQERAILAGQAPDGSGQKTTKPSTDKQKERQGISPVKPLYRTGMLADAKQWKTRKTKRGSSLRPPKARETAVAVLQARGFKTVLNVPLPKRIEEEAEKRFDQLAKEMSQ